MANLPTELITSILTRLPVKSLIRFKCVSKHWNSLISNPHLISLHLTHSLSSDNRLLVLNYGTHLETTQMSSDEGGGGTRFDLEGRFPGYEVSICGCCHGLVALVFKKSSDTDNGESGLEVLLWNPSIGRWFVVPRPPEDDDLLNTEFMGVSFGFGFDDVNHDYKIVRVVDYFFHNDDNDGGGGGGVNEGVNGDDVDGNDANNDDGYDDDDDGYDDGDDGYDDDGSEEGNHRCKYGFIFREVMVYSLKDNCWKKIHVTFFGDKMEWFCPGAVINNRIVHWLFWAYRKNKPVLRGFDLLSSKWTTLPLPDFKGILGTSHKSDYPSDVDDDGDGDSGFDYGYKPDDFVVLGVLNECLCLVTRICPEFDSAYVWVMKEYGVKESWTKLFDVTEAGIVGPLLGAPLGCCRGGDDVLLRRENEDGRLCCYDLKSKILKDGPKVPSCGLKLRDVRLCVESLVPVGKMVDESE